MNLKASQRKLDRVMARLGITPSSLRSRWARNPLLKYPRNTVCWCGSKVKAKACCLPKVSKIVAVEQLELLNSYMAHVEAETK